MGPPPRSTDEVPSTESARCAASAKRSSLKKRRVSATAARNACAESFVSARARRIASNADPWGGPTSISPVVSRIYESASWASGLAGNAASHLRIEDRKASRLRDTAACIVGGRDPPCALKKSAIGHG